MERKDSGLTLKAVAVDQQTSAPDSPSTAHDTAHIAPRVRSLSDAFEPTKPTSPAKRKSELKLVSTSLIDERFQGGDVKFSEDDEEAIIVKVDRGQWQIGFNGDDGPRYAPSK